MLPNPLDPNAIPSPVPIAAPTGVANEVFPKAEVGVAVEGTGCAKAVELAGVPNPPADAVLPPHGVGDVDGDDCVIDANDDPDDAA